MDKDNRDVCGLSATDPELRIRIPTMPKEAATLSWVHCLKWLKFHFCEPENSRPFAEFLVPIGRIIFLGL